MIKSPRISYKAAFGVNVMESTTETKLALPLSIHAGVFDVWFWLGFF